MSRMTPTEELPLFEQWYTQLREMERGISMITGGNVYYYRTVESKLRDLKSMIAETIGRLHMEIKQPPKP